MLSLDKGIAKVVGTSDVDDLSEIWILTDEQSVFLAEEVAIVN